LQAEQAPGRYRLTRDPQNRYFAWANGPQAIKPQAFAAKESLWRVEKEASGSGLAKMQFRDASRDGQAEADALDSEADSARHGATRHAWRTNKKPLPNRQGLWREGRFNAPAQPSSYYLLP
jgi:hypothetical protein